MYNIFNINQLLRILKDHVTLKTWLMTNENSKIYLNGKQAILIIIIAKLCFFFCKSNKHSLGSSKNKIKNITNPEWWCMLAFGVCVCVCVCVCVRVCVLMNVLPFYIAIQGLNVAWFYFTVLSVFCQN